MCHGRLLCLSFAYLLPPPLRLTLNDQAKKNRPEKKILLLIYTLNLLFNDLRFSYLILFLHLVQRMISSYRGLVRSSHIPYRLRRNGFVLCFSSFLCTEFRIRVFFTSVSHTLVQLSICRFMMGSSRNDLLSAAVFDNFIICAIIPPITTKTQREREMILRARPSAFVVLLI